MAESNQYDFILRADPRDLERLAQLLETIADRAEQVENLDLGKEISKSAREASREVDKIAKSAKSAGDELQKTGQKGVTAARGMSEEFLKSYDKMRKADSEFRRQVQDGVASGLTFDESSQAALSKYSAEQQQEFIDIQKAARATITGVIDENNKAFDAAEQRLPRLRYALFDVSNTILIATAAIGAMGAAIVGTSITMERQFADVIRTVGGDITTLKDDFKDLLQTLPTDWATLTEIGTLAGQLNIASKDVAEFTRLVAMFGATTDVTTEQAAVAFGRLSQLLGVPAAQFQNLGSSILQVGVNSVATESQIINTATQLAAMGNYAGFSADEVFGLSAALASLGVQPELARGTITRLFGNIETSIARGGERLELFARLSGRTVDQFTNDWGKVSGDVFLDFIRGLDQVSASGGSATMALRELGITSVRDTPAILRLAQNYQMVADTFGEAEEGFRNGTELVEQYGWIAQTTAERLNVLRNNIQALMDTLGGAGTSPAVKGLIDALSGIVGWLDRIAQNPVLGSIVALTLAFGAVTVVVGLLVAVFLRAAGALLAVGTTMREVGVSGLSLNSILEALTLAYQKSIGSINGQTAALKTNTASMAENTAASAANAKATGSVVAGTQNATKATSGFNKVLGFLGKATGWLFLSSVVWEVGASIVEAFQNSEEQTAKFNQEVQQSIVLLEQLGQGRPVDDLTGDAVQQLEQLQNEITGTLRYLELLEAQAEASGESLSSFSPFAESTNQQQLANIIAPYNEALIQLAEHSIPKAREQFNQFITLLTDLTGMSAGDLAQFFPGFKDSISDSTLELQHLNEELEAAATRIKSLVEGTFSEELGIIKSLEAANNVLEQINRTGAGSAETFKAVATAANTITEMSPENAGANLQAFFDFLIANGLASTEVMYLLQSAIAGLAAEGAVGQVTLDFNALNGVLGRVGGSAGRASRQVRTLVDYARDLASVWGRAFSIRFDSMLALDNITKTWRDLNAEIQSYQQKMMELTADRAVKEYWLSVAEAFNNTLRAGQLRAELADIDNQLVEAQAKASKELEGNSDAAIENRKRVTNLVQEYQDYIEALAASGANQAELRQAVTRSRNDFLTQAQALGYSGAQLQKYAASFDDMTTAINRVPRNITVDANTDPALQALNEFIAKASTSGGSAGKAWGDSFNRALEQAYAKAARRSAIEQQISDLTSRANAVGPYSAAALWMQISNLQQRIASGNYATGGFTGRGGMYEPAGVVHRGEYVVPARHVNQTTGLPDLSYLASLRTATKVPKTGYATGGYVTGSSVATIDPNQMRQLITAVTTQIGVVADPTTIARLANKGNQMLARSGQVGY